MRPSLSAFEFCKANACANARTINTTAHRKQNRINTKHSSAFSVCRTSGRGSDADLTPGPNMRGPRRDRSRRFALHLIFAIPGSACSQRRSSERTKGKPVATWNHPSVIRRGSGPRSITTRDADTSVALNEMPVVDLSGKTLISFTGHEVSSSICTTRQPTRRRR